MPGINWQRRVLARGPRAKLPSRFADLLPRKPYSFVPLLLERFNLFSRQIANARLIKSFRCFGGIAFTFCRNRSRGVSESFGEVAAEGVSVLFEAISYPP